MESSIKETKICKDCKQEKSILKFKMGYSKKRGIEYGPYYHSRCNNCRRSSPEDKRNQHYQKEYGITTAHVELMLKSQNGVCKICKQPETVKDRSGKIRPLSVDHNHKTMKVRGLLCANCNWILGLLKDDIEISKAITTYLKENQ